MTAHIHAHNMALYAEDAKETDKPWERWEISEDTTHWAPCIFPIQWYATLRYRRKPVEPKLVPHWPAIRKLGNGYYISDTLYNSASHAESTVRLHGDFVRLATELPPIMLPEGEVK